jgi:uncharacterized delta-60 repeat protein
MRSKLLNHFPTNIIIVVLITLAVTVSARPQQGGLDTSFGINNTGIYQDPLPDINDPVNVARYFGPVEILANGQIVTAGVAYGKTPDNNYFTDFIVRRLNADGTADLNFGTDGTGSTKTTFYRWGSGPLDQMGLEQVVMAVQPSDGKIVVAARCTGGGGGASPLGSDLCMMRYNQNGTLDQGFGGNTVTSFCGAGCSPQSYTMDAGKVWTYTGVNGVLATLNGSFNGIPVRIRFTPDNKIVVFGNSRDFLAPNQIGRTKGFVAVYSISGGLEGITNIVDTTGNTNDGFGTTRINDGDLLSDGSFFSVGSQAKLVSSNPAVFTQPKWAVFRNGSPIFLDDTTNNLPEGAFGFAQLRSNKIIVGGGTSGHHATFIRYNGDLSIDTSFGTGGKVYPRCDGAFCIAGDHIGGMFAQDDGKIIGFGDPGDIFRINPDGSPDHSFAPYPGAAGFLDSYGVLANGIFNTPFAIRGGTDGRIFYSSVAIRPNGRYVITAKTGVSGFGNPVAQADVLQVRSYLHNGGTFGDFNNDGKTEVSVYRPSEGIWHRRDSFTQNYAAAQWGIASDKIAPADYDGDGNTDRAVFRDGVWYIDRSSSGQIAYENFGTTGDLPVPGDFNGDGQADIAVFRPSQGNWYIHYSNPIQPGNVTFTSFHFGQAGDVPIFADFDGDGKSDITVFRNGAWYQLLSASDFNFRYVGFGLEGDIAVPGDFDADGKTDIGVFRAGIWYVLLSKDGSVTATPWGISSDRPVAADYDNDGKTDFGIYRDGVWWILRSSDNTYSATYFGLPSDIPIPAAYQS